MSKRWLADTPCVVLGSILAYSLALGIVQPDGGASRLATALGVISGLAAARFSSGLWTRVAGLRLRTVLLLALGLRLLWVLTAGVEQTTDFAHYDAMALDLVEGRYVLAPDKPTGPSWFLAAHYSLAGHVPLLPQITQSVLAVLQVAMTADMARRATKSRETGCVAGLILAVWPEHIFYVSLLGSDVLFATLILTAIWSIGRVGWMSPARAGAAGLALGLAHWMRPTAVLFLVSMLALLFVGLERSTPLRRRLAVGAALMSGFAACILPLAFINAQMIGVPSPFPAQLGGQSLLFGSSLEHQGQWNEDDWLRLRNEVAVRPSPAGRHPAVVLDQTARALALERVASAPGAVLVNALTFKQRNLWAQPAAISWAVLPSRYAGAYRILYGTALVFHAALLMLSAAGLLGPVRRLAVLHGEFVVYAFAGCLTAIAHAVIESQSRYHHMFLPFFAICAAVHLARVRANPSRDGAATS